MKKLLFVLSVVLALALTAGCKVVEVKPDESPGQWIVKKNDIVCVEHYKFNKETRIYYFRTAFILDYEKLSADLFRIEGVKGLRPEYYTMTVTIAKSYTWAEVEPDVVKILSNLSEYKKQGI